MILTKAAYLSIRRMLIEKKREHDNWNNFPPVEPYEVEFLVFKMNAPVRNTFIPVPPEDYMDVFVADPHIYHVFRPKKTIWFEACGKVFLKRWGVQAYLAENPIIFAYLHQIPEKIT